MQQVSKYVWTLGKPQQMALKRLYDRGPIYEKVGPGHERRITYREFRRHVIISHTMNCAMIEWSGMWVGIEPDGHTHT